MDTDIKFGILIASIFIIGVTTVAYFMVHSDRERMSKSFCYNRGYEQLEENGAFAPSFGKVNCLSCYLGSCINKEFSVKEGFWGLKEVK